MSIMFNLSSIHGIADKVLIHIAAGFIYFMMINYYPIGILRIGNFNVRKTMKSGLFIDVSRRRWW